VTGVIAALAATVAAGIGLWHAKLPASIRGGISRGLGPAFRGVRALHSGHVGDYVAWLTAGVAILGGLMAATLR